MSINRRQFIAQSAIAGAALASPSLAGKVFAGAQPLFKISLAQWSLNRAFFGGDLDVMDFARVAREKFGIGAIEYVNQFYTKTLSDALIKDLGARASDQGVESLLIMIDGEGALGDPDPAARKKAVVNHHRWADAAHALGCHSIRVNASSSGSWDEQMKRAADGLNQLAEYCKKLQLSVLVENHGGLSSNAEWLTGVMRLADNPHIGTLPDFGNFVIDRDSGESYDRYQGMAELMPFAKAVSAKSYGFDDEGNETRMDYARILKIVVDAGYRGWVGIEYEGDAHSEEDGIKLTQQLLQRVRQQLP